jgi:hypothetical protein
LKHTRPTCSAVSNYRIEDYGGYSRDRSFLAGWLPAILAAKVGVVDGLGWTAALSMIVLGTGLYTWARAIHSRWAGVYTLVFALSMAPIVVLGRTLTFYPEYVAVFCLSAGLVCVALRYRNLLNLGIAALSVGLCLLIDVRGIVWAAPSFVALCLVYLPQGRKKGALHALVLFCALGLSWWAGRYAYSADHTSLDDQANPVRLYNEHKAFGAPMLVEPGPKDIPNFVWGRTPLQDIPETLFKLTQDTQKIAPLLSDAKRTRFGRENHFDPWYPVVLPLLFLGLVSLRKRRPSLIGITATSLPFLVVLYHASTLEFTTRFASSAMPVLAIFSGLGLAVLWGQPHSALAPPADASAKASRFARSWPNWVRLAVLISLVSGLIPSYLSPRADWRVPLETDREVEAMRTGALGGRMPEAWGSEDCVEGIRSDWQNGLRPLGTLYY